jgi:hypothetical protein
MRTFTLNQQRRKASHTTSMTANILWADDEIDLLRPHVLFLQGKAIRWTP